MSEGKFEYEVKFTDNKSHELYSDMLDLFCDAIAASYSVFSFVYQETDRNSGRTLKVKIKDTEDGKGYFVTADTVHKGLVKMLADDGTPRPGAGNMAQSYVPSICSDDVAPARRVAIGLITGEFDCGTIDAGDADCIVQLGLFGEVRYG